MSRFTLDALRSAVCIAIGLPLFIFAESHTLATYITTAASLALIIAGAVFAVSALDHLTKGTS